MDKRPLRKLTLLFPFMSESKVVDFGVQVFSSCHQSFVFLFLIEALSEINAKVHKDMNFMFYLKSLLCSGQLNLYSLCW